MLYIKVCEHDSFYVGHNIEIKVVGVQDKHGRNEVVLSVDAPKVLSVDRSGTRHSRKKNVDLLVKHVPENMRGSK